MVHGSASAHSRDNFRTSTARHLAPASFSLSPSHPPPLTLPTVASREPIALTLETLRISEEKTNKQMNDRFRSHGQTYRNRNDRRDRQTTKRDSRALLCRTIESVFSCFFFFVRSFPLSIFRLLLFFFSSFPSWVFFLLTDVYREFREARRKRSRAGGTRAAFRARTP